MPQDGGVARGRSLFSLRSSLSRWCTNGLENSRMVASSRYCHRIP